MTDRTNLDLIGVNCIGNHVEMGNESGACIRVWGTATRERINISGNVVVALDGSQFLRSMVEIESDQTIVANNIIENQNQNYIVGLRVNGTRKGLSILGNNFKNTSMRMINSHIHDSVISDNTQSGDGGGSMYYGEITNVIIRGNKINNNTGSYAMIEFSGNNNEIISNSLKGSERDGILVREGSNNLISGNYIRGVNLSNSDYAGIRVLSGDNNTIIANRLRTPQARWGIRMHGGFPTNTVIMYNDVRNSGVDSNISGAGTGNQVQSTDY